jgi:hypothetical protein
VLPRRHAAGAGAIGLLCFAFFRRATRKSPLGDSRKDMAKNFRIFSTSIFSYELRHSRPQRSMIGAA